jgi:preprotein translocase SecE subunit
MQIRRPVALTARAPDSKSGCWGFESLLACHVVSERNQMPFSLRSTFEDAKQFLREVKTELKKVTWPSRKDALSGTAIVLVAVFIIATFLGIVDSGLSNLIKIFLGRAGS